MATTILKDKAAKVHVAAFGKHPGWDDHIEEIGLSSPALVWARRVLYSEGIAGNIDSGAWDRLEDEKRLPTFRHQFFWRIGDSWLVGRMWSSKDGKGRTKYPMIVCAQIEGAPSAWAIDQILPVLSTVEQKVTQTSSAELVRFAVGEAKKTLEAAAATITTTGASDDTYLLQRLVDHPGLQPDGDPNLGFERVMYEVEREMQTFKKSTTLGTRTRSGVGEAKAQHIRVPRCFNKAGEAARAWTSFLDQTIDPATPVLTLEPTDQRFVDVLVGEPGVGHMFCVRAAEKGMGLSTDVPYTIDPDFAAVARAKQAQWKRGAQTPARQAPSVATGNDPGKKGLPKWAVIGGVALVGVAVAGFMMSRSGKSGAGDAPKVDTPDKPVAKDEPVKPKPQDKPQTKPSDNKPAPQEPVAPPVKPAEKPEAKPAPMPETPVYAAGDPRKSWDGPAKLEQVETRLAALRASFDEPAADGARTVETAVREARAKWDEFRAAEFPAKELAVASGMKAFDQKVTEAQRAVEGLSAGIVQRARDVVAKAPSPVKRAELADAWKSMLAKLDPDAGPRAVRATIEDAASRAASVEQALGGALDAGVALDAGLVGKVVEARRAAAAQNAAAAMSRGDFAQAEEAAGAFGAWIASCKPTVDLSEALARALAEGFGPEEPGPDGVTMTALAARLRASPAFADLGESAGALLGAADGLAGIGASSDIIDLCKKVESGRGAEVTGAFARLGALKWPRDAEGLARAGAMFTGPVRAAVEGVKDAARRERAREQAASTARAMWSGVAAELGATEAGLRELAGAAQALGLDAQAMTSLPAWIRYNQSLVAFKAAAGAEGSDLPAALDAFLGAAGALEGADRATVEPLVAALNAIKPIEVKPDLAAIGPGGAGWRLVEGDEQRAVYERPAVGGAPVRVEFRAVSPAPDQLAMLSTTEVSVRVAASLLPAAKQLTAKTAAAVGWTFSGEGTDSRTGPRSWTWGGGEAGKEIVPCTTANASAGWLKSAPAGVSAASLGAVKAPSWDSPMQYIGAPGAMLFAKAAGCRLPTVDEWKTALATESATDWNLRDASWKVATEAWRSANPDPAQVSPITGGMYLPKQGAADDGNAVASGNDGNVWFDRVDSGGGRVFKHLRGNVAEFVLASASDVETVQQSPADGLQKLRELPKVVGGSALSPAGLSPEEPASLKETNATKGFSDVGFRLAFSLKAQTGPRNLDRGKVSEALRASELLRGTTR